MASPLDSIRNLFSSSVAATPQAIEEYKTNTAASRDMQADSTMLKEVLNRLGVQL